MIKTLLSVVFFFVLVATVGAQVPVQNLRGEAEERIRAELREKEQLLKSKMEAEKTELKGKMETQKMELKATMDAKRTETREMMQAKQEEFKKTMEAKRMELKDRMEAQRAELKKRLESFRDERKKQVVERIDKNLGELNERRIDHFTNVLNKLEEILNRIGSRADKAQAAGIDVSSVRTLIDAAKTAIAEARTAISAQAGKTYSVNVTTEVTVKTDVGATRQALHGDLKIVEEKIKAAREAVRNAAVALGQIRGVDNVQATTTPPTTTSTTSTAQ